jgi:hypothetical protein
MHRLKKVTAEFVETEDRIRLSALSADDKILAFWLTQRLLSRLITYLAKWLEKNSADLSKALSSDSNPQTERRSAKKSDSVPLPDQSAVKIKKSDVSILITEVDVNFGDKGLALVLKSEKESHAEISFSISEVRQWVSILQSLWHKAGWSISLLPQSITNNPAKEVSTNTIH